MKKKLLIGLIVLFVLFSFLACMGGEEEDTIGTANTENNFANTDKNMNFANTGDEWAIYWYLCGSDLESGGGFATIDLSELLEVELPKNVKVVIETGGSSVWQNDLMDAEVLQRWVYSSEGLELVDEQPLANMGDADTLADFLSFAKENYPAKKTAVVFWNHGGGSVSGIAFDELYGDSLDLAELYEAFTTVWEPSLENPPLELVGFDACLMATVDVAYVFNDLAHYLVASEEVEPANGWYYSEWVGALAEKPFMDGEELGITICDTYYQGCEEVGTQDNVTLSLTDLTKTSALIEAFDTFGGEALAVACENPGFFSQFGRIALQSENYGGNTKEQGYCNMVDLGHTARLSEDILDSSQDVLDALEDCVVYQVQGKYRSEATGLSFYYPYNGDINEFNGYIDLGSSTAFKYLYSYELTGELDDSGMEYIANLEFEDILEEVPEELPEVESLLTVDWDEMPVEMTEDGISYINLGEKADSILTGIGFCLYIADYENDLILMLGFDNDMEADWENGIFYDNFRGVWGSIDGNLVYMEISFEGEDYNLYSIPVLLNGEEYHLQVVYDFTTEEWEILGARQGIEDNGMSDKEMRLLEEGDEITTIWYLMTISGDDENYVQSFIQEV